MTGRLAWQLRTMADLPSDQGWLGPAEIEHLASLKIEQRRQDWLLGRWTAKQVLLSSSVLQQAGAELACQVQVLPAADGSPRVWVAGSDMAVHLSLSHRGGSALCCVGLDCRVGCDLELVEPRSPAFAEDYFTVAERSQIKGAGTDGPTVVANALWSAKESVLKLLRLGLSVDARKLEIQGSAELLGPEWSRFTARYRGRAKEFLGWWCRRGNRIVTVATAGQTDPPETR